MPERLHQLHMHQPSAHAAEGKKGEWNMIGGDETKGAFPAARYQRLIFTWVSFSCTDGTRD